MGAVETMLLFLGCLGSLWMLAAGTRGLAAERHLARRLDAIAKGDATADRKAVSSLLDRLVPGGQDRTEVERDLRAAGYPHPRALQAFAAFRIIGAIGGGLGTAALLWLTGNWQGATRLLAIAATGFSYVGAKLVLRCLASARTRQVNNEMPFVLDLMTMMLESGVSLDQCFRTLAGKEGSAAPVIRGAIAALVDDLQYGMSYAQALDRWADRLGVSGARELAGLLRQSMLQGTELGGVLREFGRDFTDKRVFRARESIGRKTTKMAVVMMIFMMPALFIVLCGPAIATISAALSGARP